MCATNLRSYGYSRDRRIVKTDDFSSVFRLRPAQKTAHFVLYVRPNPSGGNARLGVVVAKRLAARAVTRNTIKRAARELFRQTPMAAQDCVVRLARALNSKAEPATGARLRQQLQVELRQLFATQRLPAPQS